MKKYLQKILGITTIKTELTARMLSSSKLEEQELRKQALSLANQTHREPTTPQNIIETANQYLRYIKNENPVS